MKRFISMLLVGLLVLSLFNSAVFADVTEKTFNAVNDIINKTHNDGYYDADGASKFEVENGKVVLRTGDWVCYDISNLAKGTYKMTVDVYCKSTNSLAVEVDDTEVINSYSFGPGTGSYSTLTGLEVCEFVLSGSEERIKISNTGRAFYLVSFTLKKLDDLSITSVKGNAMQQDNIFARGTDSFVIEMNKEIEPSSYAEGDVVIKDDSGNTLLSKTAVNGKVITIDLKETLDYGKNYTISLKDLIGKGKEQIAGETIEYPFTTDEEDKSGNAYINVTYSEYKEGTFTAKGNIEASTHLPIKGRSAELFIKKSDAQSFELASSAVSNENGEFEISYNIPENFKSGEYSVQIKSDYIAESEIYEDSFLYFEPDFEEQVVADMSGIENIDDAITAVDKYIIYTDVDLSDFDIMINDKSKVYEKFVGRTFENAQNALGLIEETVYFECIVQTEDAEKIVAVLSDETKAQSLTGFNYIMWSLLHQDTQSNIAGEIIPENYVSFEALTKKINDLVKQEFMKENGLAIPDVNISDDEVLTGETAEIKVGLDQNVDYVYSMHFELSYEESSLSLFTDDVTVSSDYEVEYKNDVEKRLFTVNVKPRQSKTDSFSGDVFTVKIPASGLAGGIHNISLNGYVLYHPDVISDDTTHVDVGFATVNSTVKVTDITQLTINAQDIIEETEGVGYHDNENAAGERGFEKSGSAVCFREDEWAVYSIYGLAAGDYEIYVNHANKRNTDISFIIDGKTKGTADLALTGSDYSVYEDDATLRIKITGNEKLLKIYFSKEVTFVKNLTIKKVEPLKVTLSATSPSVNIGQSAQMNFSVEGKHKNITGMHIELSYDEDDSKLFESNPAITLLGNISDMETEASFEDKKIIYDVKFNPIKGKDGKFKSVTVSGDVFTLSFFAQSGTEGTYTPDFSGYFTYLIGNGTESEDYLDNALFVISENPEITVSHASGGTGNGMGSYEGGAGKPGGNMYDAPAKADESTPTDADDEKVFVDLENTPWAKESILALAEKGIVSGRGNGIFAPNDSVTRAEFCKMMVLAFGYNETDETEFSDVNSSEWYYDYVKKAKTAAIVSGRNDKIFDPKGLITREDMATICARALKVSKEAVSNDLFADDTEISEYAKESVYILRELKVIDGVGDNIYAPKLSVTRAMAAKVIYYMLTSV